MLVLDTSALLKRYVDEAGTGRVLELMAADEIWAASALAYTEAQITLCHLELSSGERRQLADMLAADWGYVFELPLDDRCLARAIEIGCAAGVRTLDALHLAAADRLPRPFRFLTFDDSQARAARAIGFELAPG